LIIFIVTNSGQRGGGYLSRPHDRAEPEVGSINVINWFPFISGTRPFP